MKLRAEVSPAKLRGGFYTPPALVRHTIRRVEALGGSGRVLEPSVGDGAFVAGLSSSPMMVGDFLGIEVLPGEAVVAALRLTSAGLPGGVETGSAIAWALRPQQPFDVVVGNLPFVRFQFIGAADRVDALRLGAEAGVAVRGVANLWLPMLLAALRHLRPGGVFALVLPAECLTGISAGDAREWLLRTTTDLRCDLYPAGSYPDVLQEVVVLSGRTTPSERAGDRTVVFAHHAVGVAQAGFDDDLARLERHSLPVGPQTWTALLLSAPHREAYEEFSALPAVRPLGSVARLEVAAVTGANGFFSLTAEEVARFALEGWVRPLLPRTRYAPGLCFSAADHRELCDSGGKGYLFDASLGLTEPPPAFIASGEALGLHERYKCRIRSPWWAVPNIKHGTLLLSKRSHHGPRLVLNLTPAVTTDTLYCGSSREGVSAPALVAGFQNSGTLLSAELEGRTFGGGVLELVPSEVARLLVPVVPSLGLDFDALDTAARSAPVTPLVDAELALSLPGYTPSLAATLAEARRSLLDRRLSRAVNLRA